MSSQMDFAQQQAIVAFLTQSYAAVKFAKPEASADARGLRPEQAAVSIRTALDMGASPAKHPIFLRLLTVYALLLENQPVLKQIARLLPAEQIKIRINVDQRSTYRSAMEKLAERCPEYSGKIQPIIDNLAPRRPVGTHVLKDIAQPELVFRNRRGRARGLGLDVDDVAIRSR